MSLGEEIQGFLQRSMLIQVPSDPGSLGLKNGTDQNVNEVGISRGRVVANTFPVPSLCFDNHYFGSKIFHFLFFSPSKSLVIKHDIGGI